MFRNAESGSLDGGGWASRRDLPSATALGNPKGEAEHAPRVFRDESGNPMCVCSSLTIELPLTASPFTGRGFPPAGGLVLAGGSWPGWVRRAGGRRREAPEAAARGAV